MALCFSFQKLSKKERKFQLRSRWMADPLWSTTHKFPKVNAAPPVLADARQAALLSVCWLNRDIWVGDTRVALVQQILGWVSSEGDPDGAFAAGQGDFGACQVVVKLDETIKSLGWCLSSPKGMRTNRDCPWC